MQTRSIQSSNTFKRCDALQIQLLESKRSMNVNIFLKQFKASNDDIVAMIRDGDVTRCGGEQLKGLLKILPLKDEVRTEALSCHILLPSHPPLDHFSAHSWKQGAVALTVGSRSYVVRS